MPGLITTMIQIKWWENITHSIWWFSQVKSSIWTVWCADYCQLSLLMVKIIPCSFILYHTVKFILLSFFFNIKSEFPGFFFLPGNTSVYLGEDEKHSTNKSPLPQSSAMPKARKNFTSMIDQRTKCGKMEDLGLRGPKWVEIHHTPGHQTRLSFLGEQP